MKQVKTKTEKSIALTSESKKGDGWYYKENGKYRKVYETPRLYSDGIWLVQTQPSCKSYQNILKLGDLPELFPYAAMAVDIDDLASYIINSAYNQELKTLVHNKDGSYSYSYGTGADQAKAILKFLSLRKEEKKKFNEKLATENKNLERVSDKLDRGFRVTREHIETRIKQLDEEKEKLQKLLELKNN